MSNFHALPDLSGYESPAAKKVQKLVKEWHAKFKEVGAVETHVEGATRDLEDARARDAEARAVAERAGKPDPGRVHEEKARDHLEALQDRLSVVRRVLALVEEDLTQALIENAPEIAKEAHAKRRQEVERYAELAPQLREAHDRERHHGGIERWTLTPNAYFTTLPANSAVLGIPMSIEEPADDEREGTVRLVG